MNEETQMTGLITTGASSTHPSISWKNIPWSKAEIQVFRLQMRIAKAERDRRKSKVKALQRLLTSSFYAKCLAVKRVTSNTGGKTPGVDGVIWKTPTEKMNAVQELRRRTYHPSPLRRIHIPKKSGKTRPLSIPTLKDRAMQALWYKALLPIAEERADPNAYGFRPKRSTHDAIQQCFVTLSHRDSAPWVLEGDIHACFDNISHDWLLGNIPMDKIVLKKFLTAGFIEQGKWHPTNRGAAQGGIISPTLMVLTLSGIEKKLQRFKNRCKGNRINMVSYADDFIVTAKSPEILTNSVMPILTESLAEVGLELSLEKTKITSIQEGFNFLGYNVRKYKNGTLLIKPSKPNVKAFLKDLRTFIKKGVSTPTDQLIARLNQKITGWTNYYRNSVASEIFSTIDTEIFAALRRWCLKRHARKGKTWIIRQYFTRIGNDNWRFYGTTKDKNDKTKRVYLKKAAATAIRRHKKIIGQANPFNPKYKEYFIRREKERKTREYASAKSAGLRIIQPHEGLSAVR